jgi:plastocyanin
MLLPAVLALLLAWPLMVSATRQQPVAHSASSPIGQAGGSATPAAVTASAAATSAVATIPAAAVTSVRARVTHQAAPTSEVKPSMTMTPSPKATTSAAPTTTAMRTTPAPHTTPAPTPTVAPHTTVPATHSAAPATTATKAPKPTHSSKPIPTPTREAPTGGTVTMGNFRYAMPDSVAPGARVAIYNADSVGHTLTIASAGIDVVVDGGSYAYRTAPTTPGSYLVTCDYHADMTATLIVR